MFIIYEQGGVAGCVHVVKWGGGAGYITGVEVKRCHSAPRKLVLSSVHQYHHNGNKSVLNLSSYFLYLDQPVGRHCIAYRDGWRRRRTRRGVSRRISKLSSFESSSPSANHTDLTFRVIHFLLNASHCIKKVSNPLNNRKPQNHNFSLLLSNFS